MGETTVIGFVSPDSVATPFMRSVAGWIAEDLRSGVNRYAGMISEISGPRIAHARNNVVNCFLENQNGEWLLMVDSDMIFDPTAIDRLFDAANPETAPIVGGLCFGGGHSGVMFPTMYVLSPPSAEDPRVIKIIEDYPENALCEVDATGAAFLLMHRSVLEKMGEQYGQPYPWFVEGSIYKGLPFGEDWAFCMRAKQLDYPIYVHTGCKIGHVKAAVLDEEAWLTYKVRKGEIGEAGIQQAHKDRVQGKAPKKVKAPTYVIIPQKNKTDMTVDLVDQLLRQGDVAGIFVYDNGSKTTELDACYSAFGPEELVELIPARGVNLHAMWNDGVARILKDESGPVNIAILNNDLRIGPHFLLRQATALRADDELVAVCPNYDKRKGNGVQQVLGTFANKGLSGFAFMFKGELYRDTPPFDEQYEWWWGDTDFAVSITESGGKLGLVYGASVEHLDGGSKTAKDYDISEAIARDKARFAEKFNLRENAEGNLVPR